VSDRSTYERAIAAYDAEHERELLDAVMSAIAEASRVSDATVMVVRTGEAASALLSALAVVLALCPSASRSPTAQRRVLDELRKRLRRRVAAAEHDEQLRDFVQRCFHGSNVEGSA
jgi:hypothetical protein